MLHEIYSFSLVKTQLKSEFYVTCEGVCAANTAIDCLCQVFATSVLQRLSSKTADFH